MLDWDTLKVDLAELLIDPGEKLRWQTHQTTIKWDGKEPIHKLATRIKRGVNKYHKNYPQAVKEDEYYARFRNAFDASIMCIIDMNCPAGSQTIDIAQDAVVRFQLTPKPEAAKSVSFAAAELNPDRATGLETSMASLATHMEDLSITMRTMKRESDERIGRVEERLLALENRGGGEYQQNDHRWGNTASSGGSRSGNSWGNQNSNSQYQSPRRPSPGRNGGYGHQSRPQQRGGQQQRGNSRGFSGNRNNNNYGNNNNNYGNNNSYGNNNNSYGNNSNYSNNNNNYGNSNNNNGNNNQNRNNSGNGGYVNSGSQNNGNQGGGNSNRNGFTGAQALGRMAAPGTTSARSIPGTRKMITTDTMAITMVPTGVNKMASMRLEETIIWETEFRLCHGATWSW